jgi:hypothetical protein
MNPIKTMESIRKAVVLSAAIAAALALGGCASFSARGNTYPNTTRPAATSVGLNADWRWNVTGDAAIRPIQVFAMRGHTYLQMRPGQVIPAVVIDGKPVSFALATPYIVVTGTPHRIDLIAQGYRALVLHEGPITVHAAPAVSASAPPAITADPAATPPRMTDGSYVVIRRRPSIPAEAAASVAAVTGAPRYTPSWTLVAAPGGGTTLSTALRAMLSAHGLRLEWSAPVDVPLRSDFSVNASTDYAAVGQILAAASVTGWRYYFSISRDVVFVTAVKEHQA